MDMGRFVPRWLLVAKVLNQYQLVCSLSRAARQEKGQKKARKNPGFLNCLTAIS